MNLKENKSGQIAMIALLVMVVVLTVGLAVISQTVTDISISEDEKEAIRAFSAAEAGIEEILKETNIQSNAYTIDDTDVNVEVAEISDDFTQTLDKGETMTVFWNAVAGPEDLTVNWVDGTKDNEQDDLATLAISIFHSNGDVTRTGWSPNNARAGQEGFTEVSAGGADEFLRGNTIGLTTNDEFIRIKALVDETTVRVSNANLPKQAFNLTSTAVTPQEKASRVVVKKTLPVMLPLFDYVLFSKGNITKS